MDLRNEISESALEGGWSKTAPAIGTDAKPTSDGMTEAQKSSPDGTWTWTFGIQGSVIMPHRGLATEDLHLPYSKRSCCV